MSFKEPAILSLTIRAGTHPCSRPWWSWLCYSWKHVCSGEPAEVLRASNYDRVKMAVVSASCDERKVEYVPVGTALEEKIIGFLRQWLSNLLKWLHRTAGIQWLFGGRSIIDFPFTFFKLIYTAPHQSLGGQNYVCSWIKGIKGKSNVPPL